MERVQKTATNPPSSLRTEGITHVGLSVSDAQESQKFYRKILGLEGERHGPGIVYVASGRDMLVLYEEGSGSTSFHFGFNVNSPSTVDQWKSWLEQHGIPISENVIEDTYRSIKFQDPDGHWIEIFYEEWAMSRDPNKPTP